MRRQVARAVAAAVDGAVAAAVDGAVAPAARPPWSPLPSPPPSGGDDDSNDGGRCRDCSRRRLLTAVAAAAVAVAASRRNIYDAPTHPGRGLEFATMPGRTTYSGNTVNTEVVLRESRAKTSWKWGASKCEKRWKRVDKVHKKIVKYQAKCDKEVGRLQVREEDRRAAREAEQVHEQDRQKLPRRESMAAVLRGVSARKEGFPGFELACFWWQ